MCRPAAGRFQPLVSAFLLLLFSQVIHASPQISATSSKPLTAIPHFIQVRDTFPPYQLNPSTILWPPDCTTADSNTCLGSSAVEGCTIKYCSKKVALTCWNHAYLIDLQCLCNTMSSTTCPSCNSGVNQQLYLAWLSVYCPLSPGWNGLPQNWNNELPGYEILDSGQIIATSSSDSTHFQTENPFTSQFITDKHTFIDAHHMPSCIADCIWLNTKWTSTFVDGNVAAALAGKNVFPADYTIGGAPQSGTLYLDLSLFCPGWTWSDLQGNCTGTCTSNLQETGLLLWLNTTCGDVTGFTGLPDNWHDSLSVVNNTFVDVFPRPSCLGVGDYPTCQLNSTESDCTRTLCSSVDQNGDCSSVSMVNIECFCTQANYNNCTGPCSSNMEQTGLLLWLNETCGSVAGFDGLPDNWSNSLAIVNSSFLAADNFATPTCLSVGDYSDCQLSATESNCTRTLCSGLDQNEDCSTVSMVNLPCFCSQVKYGTSCTANCALSWERAQYLKWLNNTCSIVAPGATLPSNWTSLLSVQRSDMLPWNWQLASDLPPNTNPQPQCPTASEKLLVFAVINILMLPVITIIGRRTVIKKLTFGYFGRQESRRWYYTGPLAVGLHLASNAVNAAIIKRTAGFENTDIETLTFFWCTRPRVSWLIVALLPFQAEKSMYFSATASILFSEVLLQLFGAYYMGVGANYARRQKFFLKGHLVGSWYAKQAMIMYAGSMLWLVAVPIAISACLWTALGVSERIGRLGEYWTQTRRVANLNCSIASKQTALLRTLKSKLDSPGKGLWLQQIQGLQNRLSTAIDGAVNDWDELKAAWKRMPTELHREQNIRRAIKMQAQKARERLESAKQGTEKWQQRWHATQTADQDEIDIEASWVTTPQTKQDEAQAHQANVEDQIYDDREQQARVDGLIRDCKRRMLPFEHAVAEAEARIAADDAQMENIKATQKRRISENGPQIFNLRAQHEAIAQQRIARLRELKTAQNDPQLSLEKNQAAKLQALFESWDVLIELKKNLRDNWVANEEHWRSVSEKRREQKVMKPKVGHFPIVVLVGMLLCWIAQWLWWAGYVGVAGDGYCPPKPKLPILGSIWFTFSATGAAFGTSF